MDKEEFISPKHYQLITEDEAKFILEHSEKQLKDILDTNLLIVSRTTTLITLAVGVLIGLTSFAINRWDKKQTWDEILITAAIGSLYLLYSIYVMSKNFRPTPYMTVGAEPKLFFTDKVFNDQNKSYRLIAIYTNEIKEYQFRIANNKLTNDKRWKIFNRSILLIMFIPVVLGITYALAYFLVPPLC